MDFDIKKPTHWFSLLMIIVSFIVFLLFPIISYFFSLDSNQTDTINNFSPIYKLIFEIFALVIQISLVIIFMILSPYIWYSLVNGLSLKQILERINLHTKNIHIAFLWAILTVFAAFSILLILGAIMNLLGVNIEDSSNIQNLEMFFSIPTILFLITLQPIAEEIFFRGFILEKINSMYGKIPAIIISSILFGMAHLSYGNIYPAMMIIFIGILLAVLVFKTKNLTAAIIAHVLFNLTSFLLYIIGKDIITEALIL